MDEEKVRQLIREELAFMIKNKKLVFPFPIQILDGNDITLGKTVGTRIGTQGYVSGTDLGQKIAFLGKTPREQYGPGYLLNHTETGVGVDNARDQYARASIADIQALLVAFGFAYDVTSS
jgi:hypothetical protein